MAAWQPKGRKTFMGRVPTPSGRSVVRSFATRDAAVAAELETFVAFLADHGRWDALAMITDGAALATEMYDAHRQGVLRVFMERRKGEIAARAARDAEPDLDRVLSEWAKVGRSAKYIRQCRRLIVAGVRFPVSMFTRRRISEFLHRLPVASPTRNRYKAALSQFAQFLVEREIIEHNPVRDIRGFKENPARSIYYDDATALAVLNALEHPYRALEALMCGTGIEWGAAVKLRKADIDFETRFLVARGTKTEWRRERTIRFLDDDCWRIFCEYAETFVGSKPLFTMLDRDALTAHHDAVAAVGAARSTLHDWRHTFAVRERKRGTPLPIIKHQLGHSPKSTLVETRYGAYVPTAEDYETAQNLRDSAKHSATRSRKRAR